MNPILNPFSRDEHPHLTAAIMGVVNETHSRKTLEGLSTTALRELRKKYQAGVAKGHADAARELADIHGILRSRGAGHALDETASPQGGGKKPFNPFNPTLGDLLRSKAQDKKAPKPKPVKEDLQTPERFRQVTRELEKKRKDFENEFEKLYKKSTRERYSKKLYGKDGKIVSRKRKPVKEAVTPAQQKVFARERERMLSALNNPNKKLSPTEREAVLARGARNAAAETRKGAVSPTGVKSPIHAAAKAHHEYARRESKKLDALAKRKVQEAAQLDERIIDEVDFFQASKNWITGKGFKTNREAAYDRVEKNYAAMKKREAAKAKKTK